MGRDDWQQEDSIGVFDLWLSLISMDMGNTVLRPTLGWGKATFAAAFRRSFGSCLSGPNRPLPPASC